MRKTIFVSAILVSVFGGEAFAQTATTTWKKVADENQSFSLSGTQTVRYGIGSKWVQKSLSGKKSCKNSTFGTDPARGYAKVCEVAVATVTAPATTWTNIAAEDQRFTLSSTQTVRYGTGSSWIEKTLSGTQTCSNATFGKDPAYGYGKVCQIASTTGSSTTAPTPTPTPAPTPTPTPSPTPTPTPTPTLTWAKVADEDRTFSLTGTQTVRYGAGSSWIEKTLSGTQTCSNATFGKDPAYGIGKTCQVMSQSTTTPAPTPTSYSARLEWTAPSTREDGVPLAASELKGYEIYYTSDDLSQAVTLPVSSTATTSYSVTNLKAGTYHFAISAIDSNGLKSKLSTMVSATFGK